MVSWPLKELLSFIVIFYHFFVNICKLLQKSSSLKLYRAKFDEDFVLRVQLRTTSGYRIFSLHWRPIGGLRLLSALWMGCCLFDIFPISILNFIIWRVDAIYCFNWIKQNTNITGADPVIIKRGVPNPGQRGGSSYLSPFKCIDRPKKGDSNPRNPPSGSANVSYHISS